MSLTTASQGKGRSIRRYQRGVASTELAIALPVLILVIGSAVTVGRLVHTKIKLDGFAQQAAHDCALKPQVSSPELAEACMTDLLNNPRLSGCTGLTSTVEFDWLESPAGEGARSPFMTASVECTIETLEVGNFVPDTVLKSVVTASRN